ncbi:transposase [Neisseria meningitidis]|nr:transposase [Neisseria meningitidis]CWU20336.1 transposase [Neisseria meningitidis]
MPGQPFGNADHILPEQRVDIGFVKHIFAETFAKFLSLTTTEIPTQVFGCFRPKYRLILPKHPLNPARIPDNQASGRLLGGSGRT